MALSDKEFATKAKNLELTLGEAIEYALDRPKITPTQKNWIKPLANVLESNTDLKLSTPFHEMQDEINWSQLDPDLNKSGNNYYYNFQNLETVLHKKMQELGVKNVMKPGPDPDIQVEAYPKVAGQNSISGGTQRSGAGDGTRPMRGLLPAQDIVDIYDAAIPEVQLKYGTPVADAMTYHLISFNRPEQLVGASAIKLSDVTITDTHITINEIKVGHKTRPANTFPRNSKMGQLIERNYRRQYDTPLLDAKGKPKNIAPTNKNLFPISKETFDKAFRESVSPRLKVFEDVLPVNAKTGNAIVTPSAVRSFMPRMLIEEKKVPKELVKAIQGHTGADILTANYVGGLPPDEGIGILLDKLAEDPAGLPRFDSNLITSQQTKAPGFVGVDLTEEQQAVFAEAATSEAELRGAEAQEKLIEKRQNLIKKRQEDVAFWKSEEGQRLLLEEAEVEELQRQAKVAAKVSNAPVEEPEFKKFEFSSEESDDLAKAFDEAFGVEEDVTTPMDDPDAPKKGKTSIGKTAGKIAGGILAPLGIGLGLTEKAQAAEQEISTGRPVLPTVVGKAAEFIYEDVSPFSLPGQLADLFGDVQPATAEEQLTDPYSFTDTDVGTIRKEQKRRDLNAKDRFSNFLSEDLIQP